jgi:flagellar hook-associated protein 3 FlgL
MSTPRITQRLMVERSLASLQSGLGRVSRVQEQLSSGRVINRPSDSPTGTNAAMRLRAQLAADGQYARNAQDGLGWLGQTDSVLGSMIDNVGRARDLLVQGASTGSNGPDARGALATELGQIRESLIGQANTSYMGRPLFGGTTGGDTAYDATGAWVGDPNAVNRAIGENDKVRVNTTGPEAFSAGSDDLFAVLTDAVDALRNNPAAISGALGRLDSVFDSMRTAHADVGTRYGRVESALTRLNDVTLENQSALSDIENVDVGQAAMDLQLAQVAYQASLGATARVIQPSLLDFLR